MMHRMYLYLHNYYRFGAPLSGGCSAALHNRRSICTSEHEDKVCIFTGRLCNCNTTPEVVRRIVKLLQLPLYLLQFHSYTQI